MTKEELKRELEDVTTLYVVGIHISQNRHWDYGLWRRFSVYYLKDGELKKIWIDPEETDIPCYWVPLHQTKSGSWIGGYFETNVIGSDRVFEIVYDIGQWLFGDGYRFKYNFLSY